MQEVIETGRRGDWMQTYTGRAFWPLDPRAEELHPADIAHSLSQQCRFAGHCSSFYSVAQHSLIVASIAPYKYRLEALLHDAAEAYLVDLPRPVKRQVEGYAETEDRLSRVIADWAHAVYPWPAAVRMADEIALATEARDLMGAPPIPWGLRHEPWPEVIVPRYPLDVEQVFLSAITWEMGRRSELLGDREEERRRGAR